MEMESQQQQHHRMTTYEQHHIHGSRTFSTSTAASVFSDCNSDRSSDDFSSSESVLPYDRLVSDLCSSSEDAQLSAARHLRLLAKHSPDNRLAIAKSGAVLPLVDLLSSPNPRVQEQAVTAVLNLSLCDDNKPHLAAAGAVRPLVSVLLTGNPTSRENAACALLRLAQGGDELRSMVGRSGAIPALVSMLGCGATSTSTITARGMKDAVTALYALCSGARENKARAVAAGAVLPLLEMMADPESGMVDKAAYLLATLTAGVTEARTNLVAEGGVPVLVELLEAGSQRQKEIAADVLLQVCEESAVFAEMVFREGAVPALAALAQSGSPRARKKAEALMHRLRKPRSPGSILQTVTV